MNVFLYIALILLYSRVFPRDRLTCKERLLLILISLATAALQHDSVFALEIPVLLYAALVDRRTGEIPDMCSVLLVVSALQQPGRYPLAALCVLALAGLLSYAGLLGFGDVKLMAAWTFGHGRLIISGLGAACWPCLIYCLAAARKKQIPFAPFLAFGFLFVQLLS